MSNVMARSHIGIRKFQLTTATMAVVAATTLTPMVAQAAPNFGPFVQGIGDSVSLVVEPVVIPTSSFKAAAVAAADAVPCTGARIDGACHIVEGVVAAASDVVDGVVKIVGQITYVLVEATGQLFQVVGAALPGQLGVFFTNVGEGVSAVAANIGETLHVGPYSTSE